MEILSIGERQIVNLTPNLKSSFRLIAGVALVKMTRSERMAEGIIGKVLGRARLDHPEITEFALRPPSIEFANALMSLINPWEEKTIGIFPYQQPVHVSLSYLNKYREQNGFLAMLKEVPKEIGQIIMRFSGSYVEKVTAIAELNLSEVIVKQDQLTTTDPLNRLPEDGKFAHVYVVPSSTNEQDAIDKPIQLTEHTMQTVMDDA